jgi:hypothetical protein
MFLVSHAGRDINRAHFSNIAFPSSGAMGYYIVINFNIYKKDLSLSANIGYSLDLI